MNKTELIKSVTEKTGLSKSNVDLVFNAVVDSIFTALCANEKVQIPNLGTFEVRERAARSGRNPFTGEQIEISARKVVNFKAGKKLKENL